MIWLNGAFGAGKTRVARELSSQVPDSIMFDPELIGLMLRQTIPEALRASSDFQDLPLWRSLTNDTIEGLLEQYKRPVVVAMTVVNPDYFDQLVGRLRRAGRTVHHFTLIATPATIRARLLTRPSWPLSTLWALRQVERCTAALESSTFEQHVATDNTSVADVVATIRRHAAI